MMLSPFAWLVGRYLKVTELWVLLQIPKLFARNLSWKVKHLIILVDEALMVHNLVC